MRPVAEQKARKMRANADPSRDNVASCGTGDEQNILAVENGEATLETPFNLSRVSSSIV